MENNKITVDNSSISIESLYKSSFKIFLNNIVVCIANTIIATVASILLCITVIGIMLLPAVWGGYTESMIRMSLGQKVEIGKFFSAGFNRWGTLLFAGIIYCIGILIGLVCFILPGIYLMIRWFFTTQIIVYEGLNASEAFTKSGDMVSNKFWEVTVVFVICTIIETIGGIIGVLILATIPYISIVSAKYYISNLNNMK
tara:strand:+ start:82 stop:678 length:597 start_codon:yes stop_codon:yes gene_type:complete